MRGRQGTTEPPAVQPPPVEPLSDLSWQRIERGLFAALGAGLAAPDSASGARPTGRASGRGRVLALAAGGAALAAAAAIFLAVGPLGSDRDRAGGSGHEARLPVEEAAAPRPSRITTTEAPSAVTVGDVALEVAPHSAVLVDDRRPRGSLIVLERGELLCRVGPRAADAPVVVQAGDLRIEVTGTAFAVARVGDSAQVVVHEGQVSLVHQGERFPLEAGERWPAAAAPKPAPELGAEDERSKAAARRVRESHGGSARAQAAPPQASPPAAAPPPSGPSRKERYEAAARLEGRDPERALAGYRQLAAEGGPWAANALYAEARLELELGRTARARRLLRRYLDRFPDGLNAEDARSLLEGR